MYNILCVGINIGATGRIICGWTAESVELEHCTGHSFDQNFQTFCVSVETTKTTQKRLKSIKTIGTEREICKVYIRPNKRKSLLTQATWSTDNCNVIPTRTAEQSVRVFKPFSGPTVDWSLRRILGTLTAILENSQAKHLSCTEYPYFTNYILRSLAV